VVVGATLVVGTVLLAYSLRVPPGNARFYVLTSLLAAVWIVGAVLSGPLHLGHLRFRDRLRRPVLTPVIVGLLLAGVFLLGGLVVREMPALRFAVADVLAYATFGNLAVVAVITAVNGVAEELFFRGGLYAAAGRVDPVLMSTAVYSLTTVFTGNAMLVFAAITVGLVLGLQRRASGGVLAPMITHVTWSLSMLFALAPVIRA
jgi:membrane protease YdiL (CAAX protease family)